MKNSPYSPAEKYKREKKRAIAESLTNNMSSDDKVSVQVELPFRAVSQAQYLAEFFGLPMSDLLSAGVMGMLGNEHFYVREMIGDQCPCAACEEMRQEARG